VIRQTVASVSLDAIAHNLESSSRNFNDSAIARYLGGDAVRLGHRLAKVAVSQIGACKVDRLQLTAAE